MNGIIGIASALIGVALIALLVNKNANTVAVVNAATGGFNSLLRTVTLQNGMSMSGY
jgi:PRD1 phage membrane DNA delivery